MSDEHTTSEAVLRALSGGKNTLTVTGSEWQKMPVQTVGISSLTAKVLCKRHNELLGPLDQFMGTTFAKLIECTTPLLSEKAPPVPIWLVNGHDVERWMLKTLCGTLRANATTEGIGGGSWSPSAHWLQILRGQARWPDGWGLYLDQSIGVRWGTLVRRPIVCLTTRRRHLVIGLSVWIHGLALKLLMTDPRQTVIRPDGAWFHRPREIRWVREDRIFSLVFGWKYRSRNPTARVNVLLHGDPRDAKFAATQHPANPHIAALSSDK